MAKNDSVIWYRGQNLKAGTLGRMLPKHWTEFTNAITQKVILYGGAESKACAKDLLAAAQAICPVGPVTNARTMESAKNHEKGNGVGSASFNSRMSSMGKFSTAKDGVSGMQFRNSLGHYSKKVEIVKERNGLHSFTHQAGSLRESGRVIEYQQSDGERKKGYEVSFDTRRNDPRSMANNFNYAVIQHEDMNFKHKKGQAKFLFIPYQQLKGTFMSRIAEETKRAFKKGGGGK